MGISIAYACIFHIYYIEGEGANPTTWREKKRRAWILSLCLSLSHLFKDSSIHSYVCHWFMSAVWVCAGVRFEIIGCSHGCRKYGRNARPDPSLRSWHEASLRSLFASVCVCFLAFHLIGLLEWPQIAKKKTPSHSQRLTQTLTHTHRHTLIPARAKMLYWAILNFVSHNSCQ